MKARLPGSHFILPPSSLNSMHLMNHSRRRIVITGFMGAGKTTVAVALSRLLGCASLDLDDLITAREGRPPQQLIDEDGEAAFRECETLALREALASDEAC